MFIPLILILITRQWASAAVSSFDTWNITFEPTEPSVLIDQVETIVFNLSVVAGSLDGSDRYLLTIETGNPNLLDVQYNGADLNPSIKYYFGEFNITGIFLGKTNVIAKVRNASADNVVWQYALPIKVLRPQRTLDKIFTVSVAVLVSLIYVNFGCALNWDDVRTTLRKPVGPAIGLVTQFLLMPLISYCLGLLLFPNDIDMQLGMFFTGVAPSGGASNMWTLLLGGNLSLSVTMTALSNFAAFAMMPFWIFTLGRNIFHNGNIPVPYGQISTYAIALIVPLLIGYLLQRFLPSIGEFLKKILKGFASLLLIFIIVFAIVANFYLFQLFSWQLIISGLGLPWLGYLLAWLFARYVCRQNSKDALTIAIETGIQNTGIAIFLLRFTLPQPEADITTIAPVSVATMTPIPLVLCYIIQKIRNRRTSESLNDYKPQEE